MGGAGLLMALMAVRSVAALPSYSSSTTPSNLHTSTDSSTLCGTGFPVDHQGFELTSDYNKNIPPGKNNNVSISLFINRVSAVDENKEEISLDVFLQVYWEDPRIKALEGLQFVELPWEHRHTLWMPDLYIRQLREMRVLSLFQEMTSVRLFMNGTIRVSIGATIIIKCDMDFVLYPLDIQICAVDFSSYKYTAQELTFGWKDDSPVSFPSDFGDGFRLPKYVVSFSTDHEERIIFYGEGNHSTARLLIKMSREIRSYLLESYLPSSLFVIISWGSFCVIPEIVPGRMVLLVTTLLSLVTMFDTVRNNSPDALELKCIEVWLISCTMFVFLALMEYFVVLFGIRYDKAWKRRPRKPPLPTPIQLPATILANHSQIRAEPSCTTPAAAAVGPHAAAMLHGGARVMPTEDEAFKQQLAAQSGGTLQARDSPTLEASQSIVSEAESGSAARFRASVERLVLFCGAQRGSLDRFSLCVFPLSFIVFTAVYWMCYLHEANKQLSK